MQFDVELQNNVNALLKLKRELKKRGIAFQRYVMSRTVQDVMDSVVADMPRRDPDMESYSNNLQIVRARAAQLMYAVVHDGRVKTAKVGDLDGEKTLLYIRSVVHGDDRHIRALRELEPLGPFTLSTWPPLLPKDRALVVYRTVTNREVNRVREKNKSDRAAIVSILGKHGLRMRLRDVEVKGMTSVSDFTFQVLRKEFGLGTKKHPHWRPALRLAAAKAEHSRYSKDKKAMQTLLDPKYSGWKRLGMTGKEVESGSLEDLDEFQQAIVGGDV